MFCYKVGSVIEAFKGRQEGTLFDIADDGAMMIVFYDKPTKEEIEQFNAGKNFEIRFIELRNLIMITAKIGNLAWIDAPYDVHLSKNLSVEQLQVPAEGDGLGLTLMLIDGTTGEIKSMRLIGLSTSFTKEIFRAVREQSEKAFSMSAFNNNLMSIYNSYATDSIVRMSKYYFKVKEI